MYKIEWITPAKKAGSENRVSVYDLIEKLERSLWLRRDECRSHIKTLSWDKIKIKNKRTWTIIKRG